MYWYFDAHFEAIQCFYFWLHPLGWTHGVWRWQENRFCSCLGGQGDWQKVSNETISKENLWRELEKWRIGFGSWLPGIPARRNERVKSYITYITSIIIQLWTIYYYTLSIIMIIHYYISYIIIYNKLLYVIYKHSLMFWFECTYQLLNNHMPQISFLHINMKNMFLFVNNNCQYF